MQLSSARRSPARSSSAGYDADQQGTMQLNRARSSSAAHDAAQQSTMQFFSARRNPAGHKADQQSAKHLSAELQSCKAASCPAEMGRAVLSCFILC